MKLTAGGKVCTDKQDQDFVLTELRLYDSSPSGSILARAVGTER